MTEHVEYEKLQPGMALFAKSTYHHKKFYQYLFITGKTGGEVQGRLITFTFRGHPSSPSGLTLRPGSVGKIGKGFYEDDVYVPIASAMKKRLIYFLFMSPEKLA